MSKLLTVSANVSLSTMWLARRLAEFSALHPETPVNTIIQMEEPNIHLAGIQRGKTAEITIKTVEAEPAAHEPAPDVAEPLAPAGAFDDK